VFVTRSIPFYEPESVEQALDVLAHFGEDARPIAGGTAVSILLRQRLIEPAALVSLTGISGLREIEVVGGVLRLGALVRHRDVELSPAVREEVPVLAEAFGHVGNVRVRHAATVGGVLAEADYASDPPCVVRALDAEVEVTGVGGKRTIPIADFFVGFFETALHSGELVTALLVPVPDPSSLTCYTKFRTRSSEDRPCVGVAALVRTRSDGVCEDIRVAVGAAMSVPLRLPAVEQEARGRALTEDLAGEIAEGYASAASPLDDIRGSAWYRREMIRVLVRRSLLELAAS
jgi:carbon-monoxide dehydrogenase medium subunit